jgi:hypothetical protein
MKCGTGLDAGILGRGRGIEYLMGIPVRATAIVILGELCPGKKS